MKEHLQSIVTLLSLINPMVCGGLSGRRIKRSAPFHARWFCAALCSAVGRQASIEVAVSEKSGLMRAGWSYPEIGKSS
jgi:hypothetical protein